MTIEEKMEKLYDKILEAEGQGKHNVFSGMT